MRFKPARTPALQPGIDFVTGPADRMSLAFEQFPSEHYGMSITTTVEGGKIVLPPDVH
jgi:hypothetical protein